MPPALRQLSKSGPGRARPHRGSELASQWDGRITAEKRYILREDLSHFRVHHTCKSVPPAQSSGPGKLKDIGGPLDTCHKLFKMTEMTEIQALEIPPVYQA